MTWYLVHDDTKAVSIGTVLADPLPDGLTAVTLTADQAAAVAKGRVSWADGQVVVAPPPTPDPDPIEARLSALEAKAAEADTLKAVLVDKGVIAEADVAVALDAAAEAVVDIKR